jgi:hypothetical protein
MRKEVLRLFELESMGNDNAKVLYYAWSLVLFNTTTIRQLIAGRYVDGRDVSETDIQAINNVVDDSVKRVGYDVNKSEVYNLLTIMIFEKLNEWRMRGVSYERVARHKEIVEAERLSLYLPSIMEDVVTIVSGGKYV